MASSNDPDQPPQFCQVFVKSEPTEEQGATTSDSAFSYDAVVKEELIIEQDETATVPTDKDDDDEYKVGSVGLKYLEDGCSIECDECGKIIPDYKAYVQHTRRHRNVRERRFHCKPCNKVFSDRGDLLRHTKRFHDEQKTTPTTGGMKEEQVTDEEVVSEARVLEEKGIFVCSECKKTFQKRHIAVAHIEGHENLRKGLYKCPTCGKCFAKRTALAQHERAHQVMQATAPPPSARARSPIEVMRQDEVAFKCAECGIVFGKRKSYFKHARRHDIIKRGDFQCPICNVYLGARSELDRHLEKHQRNKLENKPSKTPYAKADEAVESSGLICGTCNKLLPNYHSLKRHIQRHDDLEKGTFKCNQCEQYFSTKHGLELHLRKYGHSQQTAPAEEGSNNEGCANEEMEPSDTQQASKPAKPKLVLKKIVVKKGVE